MDMQLYSDLLLAYRAADGTTETRLTKSIEETGADPKEHAAEIAALIDYVGAEVPEDFILQYQAYSIEAKKTAALKADRQDAIESAARAREILEEIDRNLAAGVDPNAAEVIQAISDLQQATGKILPKESQPGTCFHFTLADSLVYKPANWLVNDYLEKESLSETFGDTGSYKTFAVLDQGCSIAAGIPWHDYDVQQGSVVYICGEGRQGIKKRILAWCAYYHVDPETLPLFVSSGPASLIDPTGLIVTLEALRALPECPVLIIIDTLNRNFGAGDENNSVDMTAFVQACDKLKMETGAAVMIVHHTGLSNKERSRGHSSLKAALDFEYRIDRDDTGVIRFECTKCKDYEIPQPLAFRPMTVSIELPEEAEVSSCVLVPTSYEPQAKKGKTGGGKWQTLALDLLQSEIARHRKNVEDSGRDPDTARVSVDAWRTACINEEMPRQRFYDVVNSLTNNHMVEINHGFVSLLSASGSVVRTVPSKRETGQDGHLQENAIEQNGLNADEKRIVGGQVE